MRYANPVIPGFHPDPSVCRVGDDFYLVTSSFEYFPGVPVFHSRDLVHWKRIGHCLTRKSQLDLTREPASRGIFAPTIRHHQGRFYMVTTHITRWQNFYVSTDDPAGEWSDPIWVEQSGIDPSLLFDRDGTVYLTSNGGIRNTKYEHGIHQSVIDVETGEFLRTPQLVWKGTGGGWPEGPHLYHIGPWYYLMIAEGGTEYGHMETIARSRTPFGRYEPCPFNPILSNRSADLPIQGTGHADMVFDTRNHCWLVCLGFRPVPYPPRHHLGRETFLAPVTWEADGWPRAGDDGRLALEMDGRLPKAAPVPEETGRDDFDSPRLGLHWNFLRNPYERDWSLTERPGHLRLHGSAVDLGDTDSPAWIGRRQCHFDCRVRTHVEFAPQAENEEAGLAIRMNERFRYEVAISRRDGKRCVITRRTLGTLSAEGPCEAVPDGPLELGITADKDTYRLSWAVPGRKHRELLAAECGLISKEIAGGFTGVYLAMYASGNGKPCAGPADFDWFEYASTGVSPA